MTPSIAKENARTLAALAGVDDARATELLDQAILVSADPAPGSARLASFVTQLLRRTFSVVDTTPTLGRHYAAEVVVDSAERQAPLAPAAYVAIGNDAVFVDALPHRSRGGICHDLILLLGACYASATATKLAIPSIPMAARRIELSATDLLGPDADVLRTPFDLGEAHLAGAGAVGNAFVKALATLDVSGTLHVCDRDAVSAGNGNRCLFFEPEHVGENKAATLAREAQPLFARLRLVPFEDRLEDFSAAPDGRTFRRLIVGVDSRRARRNLQLEFPREVYDASTTGIDEVVLHFNRLPTEAACLSCIYHQEELETAREAHIAEMFGVTVEEVRENWISADAATRISARYPALTRDRVENEAYDSLFKELCGEGRLLAATGQEVLAPFAFVSMLAGGLLALELARRLVRDHAVVPFNYWRASPWSAPVPRLRAMLPQRAECEFCGKDAFRTVARQLWG